jgi:hypothetical protein
MAKQPPPTRLCPKCRKRVRRASRVYED